MSEAIRLIERYLDEGKYGLSKEDLEDARSNIEDAIAMGDSLADIAKYTADDLGIKLAVAKNLVADVNKRGR